MSTKVHGFVSAQSWFTDLTYVKFNHRGTEDTETRFSL